MLSRWASQAPSKFTPQYAHLVRSAHSAPLCTLARRRGPGSPWQTRNHSTAAGPSPAWSSTPPPASKGQSLGLVQSDAQRSTIYALSTPPGKAGVAVIRVSGPDALNVWQSMVLGRKKNTSREGGVNRSESSLSPTPWKMYRCEVVHPQSKEVLDSGLAVYFKGRTYTQQATSCRLICTAGPKSFTGEDIVEFHIHSGRAILNSVLSALSTFPSLRLAEPGEFTRRAFESGRLDLTEVEGLHDLINADTSSQRQAALQAVGVSLSANPSTVAPADRGHAGSPKAAL